MPIISTLILHGYKHPPGTLQLMQELGMKALRRGSHMNRIVRPFLPVALSAISADESNVALFQQCSAVFALGHVVDRESDERWEVIDPYDLAAARWDFLFVAAGAGDEVGEDVGEVAGAGADVEDAGGGVEEGEERFTGGGVHVGGGDCGAVADGLGGVFVGGGWVWAVVGTVDL